MAEAMDSSLDPMAEIRFRKKHGHIWVEVLKETHFNYDELENPPNQTSNKRDLKLKTLSAHFDLTLKATLKDCKTDGDDHTVAGIMVIFYKIQRRDEKPHAPDLISRSHFKDVLHNGLGMTDTYMMERVMVALDRSTSPYVTMSTFSKAMSLFLRGSLDERIAYVFKCYDLLGEGYLRREIMYQLLKKSLAKSSTDDDVEEAVQELVDILLKRMDTDLDGVISFEDYQKSIQKTPSFLEFLGYCLPERPAVYNFVSTWAPNWAKM